MTERRRSWTASLAWTLVCGGVLGLATPGEAQIVVDDRVVETQAAGPCTDLLTTGEQRYVDCGNGTVLDAFTNLLWLQDAACAALGAAGFDTWLDAQQDVADLQEGLCELTDGSQPGDWRLPTVGEWIMTVDFALFEGCIQGGTGGPPSLTGDPGTDCFGDGSTSSFQGVASESYWAATVDPFDPTDAVVMDLVDGQLDTSDRNTFANGARIWPVRPGGGPPAMAALQLEGYDVETQADGPCYEDAGTGQERYVDCGDGTVLDLFTGLLWLEDATCAELPGTDAEGRGDWPTAKAAVATLGGSICGLSDGSQPGDWRLPSEDEWETTTQRGRDLGCTTIGADDPPPLTDITGKVCLVDGSTPFDGLVVAAGYWTGSAADTDSDAALALDMGLGIVVIDRKDRTTKRIWPIRDRK